MGNRTESNWASVAEYGPGYAMWTALAIPVDNLLLMINSRLTSLERTVLRAICEMYPSDRAALENQLSAAVIGRRQNTGAGFYTDFEVPSVQSALSGERMRTGPNAKIDGLEHGMGFILWLHCGYVTTLEGYSFGEDTSSIDFEAVGCQINSSLQF